MALEDRDRIFDYYEFDQESPRVAVLVDERIAQAGGSHGGGMQHCCGAGRCDF
ncbi:hypothetical protein [Variovorax sp. WS11]|uniref:hypothetical protein n=1 Tax=Variovorax sp. WS11 TaxID=1105204 RepID=UPI0015E779DE|nr:hypothetical protein [Variovorax sp. WS11]